DIVENLGLRPEDRERFLVGAVGEFEAAQPVIRGRETQPGFAVTCRPLDRAAEVLFGETVVLLAIVPLAKIEIVVRITALQRVGDVRIRRGRRNGGARNGGVDRS